MFGSGGWASEWDDEVGEFVRIWYNGHRDFANLEPCPFDFEKEDEDWRTSPVGSPANHFQQLINPEHEEDGSLFQIDEAIKKFSVDEFERAMHRGQDYYSHYDKGYRWDPVRIGNNKLWIPELGQWGHLDTILNPFLASPDRDNVAWEKSNRFTKKYLKKWSNHCCRTCCDKCEWVPKSTGRCGKCGPPKMHETGRQLRDASDAVNR
ncbi:MAG: hypothetical protein K9N23_20630 [Akkermansiaceae bacterium]|nr:hypothetical protein [Akkermansiaceae bacterium]MCF7734102.1 hypothetical protein [Akkermansiaceae bacterium]